MTATRNGARGRATLYGVLSSGGLTRITGGPHSRSRLLAAVAAHLGCEPEALPRHPTTDEAAQLREAAAHVGATLKWRKRARQVPPSRQAEFDAALRVALERQTAQLRAMFDDQVARVAGERVAARIAELDAREAELADQETQLRALRAGVVQLLSFDEFRLVRSCLHPDRAPAGQAEKFSQAFQIFQRFEAAANASLPAAELRARGWDHLAPYRRR